MTAIQSKLTRPAKKQETRTNKIKQTNELKPSITDTLELADKDIRIITIITVFHTSKKLSINR